MKLGKPPIIQAWIEFRFDRSLERGEWGLEEASTYLDMFQDVYLDREVIVQHQYKVEKVKKNLQHQVVDTKMRLHTVRAANKDASRFIQLTKDGFACNFLRTENGYEGYTALKMEALDKFRSYVDLFRPTQLQELVLHYVDLILIPFEDKKGLNLSDYFALGITPPESFGSIIDFTVMYATQPVNTNDLMEVRLQDERQGSSNDYARFRMDWRLSSLDNLSLNESALSSRLDQAHDQILNCFRKSFTEKAWQMFEPISEEM